MLPNLNNDGTSVTAWGMVFGRVFGCNQSVETKRCCTCKATKPSTAFYRNEARCKDCARDHSREWCRRRRATQNERESKVLTPKLPTEKRCAKCRAVKPVSEFGVVSYKTDTGNRSKKLRSKCRACERAYNTERRVRVGRPQPHPLDAPKRCSNCGVVQAADRFLIRRTTLADGTQVE